MLLRLVLIRHVKHLNQRLNLGPVGFCTRYQQLGLAVCRDARLHTAARHRRHEAGQEIRHFAGFGVLKDDGLFDLVVAHDVEFFDLPLRVGHAGRAADERNDVRRRVGEYVTIGRGFDFGRHPFRRLLLRDRRFLGREDRLEDAHDGRGVGVLNRDEARHRRIGSLAGIKLIDHRLDFSHRVRRRFDEQLVVAHVGKDGDRLGLLGLLIDAGTATAARRRVDRKRQLQQRLHVGRLGHLQFKRLHRPRIDRRRLLLRQLPHDVAEAVVLFGETTQFDAIAHDLRAVGVGEARPEFLDDLIRRPARRHLEVRQHDVVRIGIRRLELLERVVHFLRRNLADKVGQPLDRQVFVLPLDEVLVERLFEQQLVQLRQRLLVRHHARAGEGHVVRQGRVGLIEPRQPAHPREVGENVGPRRVDVIDAIAARLGVGHVNVEHDLRFDIRDRRGSRLPHGADVLLRVSRVRRGLSRIGRAGIRGRRLDALARAIDARIRFVVVL